MTKPRITKHSESPQIADSASGTEGSSTTKETRRKKYGGKREMWNENGCTVAEMMKDLQPLLDGIVKHWKTERVVFKFSIKELKEPAMRVWCVGADQTEYYAARDKAELRKMYVEMVGEEQTAEDFAAHCEEVPESCLDSEFEWNDNGNQIKTTWRKQIENVTVPCQISTGYN